MAIFYRNILIFFTLVFLMLCSCASTLSRNSASIKNTESIDSLFTVNKIDSVNNYYLVYLKKDKNWYKIVSKKDGAINSKKIKINSSYKFCLKSIWNQEILIAGVNVSPSLTPHVTCLGFDKETSICIERDSINDLFVTKNLKGLFYIKNN
ncbi:hypothetical protein [Flavobacterium tructae]|uniref:hypothetical protein n=1 Tax=Flavobacterium tructae TaxID=1114873 RepID=UPI0035A8C7B7